MKNLFNNITELSNSSVFKNVISGREQNNLPTKWLASQLDEILDIVNSKDLENETETYEAIDEAFSEVLGDEILTEKKSKIVNDKNFYKINFDDLKNKMEFAKHIILANRSEYKAYEAVPLWFRNGTIFDFCETEEDADFFGLQEINYVVLNKFNIIENVHNHGFTWSLEERKNAVVEKYNNSIIEFAISKIKENGYDLVTSAYRSVK